MFTFHISSSEYCPIGSRLLLTVPSKRTGSWGMIPNRDLRSWSPNMQMSRPSIIILPPEGSTSLKKTWIKVDFPLPVRPTTPIFSPPWMLRVMPLITRGVFGRYLTCTPKIQGITINYCNSRTSIDLLYCCRLISSSHIHPSKFPSYCRKINLVEKTGQCH